MSWPWEALLKAAKRQTRAAKSNVGEVQPHCGALQEAAGLAQRATPGPSTSVPPAVPAPPYSGLPWPGWEPGAAVRLVSVRARAKRGGAAQKCPHCGAGEAGAPRPSRILTSHLFVVKPEPELT